MPLRDSNGVVFVSVVGGVAIIHNHQLLKQDSAQHYVGVHNVYNRRLCYPWEQLLDDTRLSLYLLPLFFVNNCLNYTHVFQNLAVHTFNTVFEVKSVLKIFASRVDFV